jgi:hypothetical protein
MSRTKKKGSKFAPGSGWDGRRGAFSANAHPTQTTALDLNAAGMAISPSASWGQRGPGKTGQTLAGFGGGNSGPGVAGA